MLGKKNRLTKNGSFSYVYRKGKFVSNKFISLNYAPSRGEPKVGFTVSNKIGHAVTRNKLKRRLRAIVRQLLPRLSGCQAVITAMTGILTKEYRELYESVKDMFVKVGLYEEEKGVKNNIEYNHV